MAAASITYSPPRPTYSVVVVAVVVVVGGPTLGLVRVVMLVAVVGTSADDARGWCERSWW